MRKIFKLKKWFSLSQAAAYLSEAFEDEITEADIFQFADDKKLTLSVNFFAAGTAFLGKVVPVEAADVMFALHWENYEERDFIKNSEIPAAIADIIRKICSGQKGSLDEKNLFYSFIKQNIPEKYQPVRADFRGHLLPDSSGVIEIDNEHIHSIEGIWDIPMIGGDQVMIRKKLLEHINGAELWVVPLSNTFLVSEDRQEWAALLDFAGEYRSTDIPDTASIVIRTTELQRFIDSFNEAPSPSHRSEDNNLKTIAVLTKALADRLGSGYGSPDKPNLSRIYEDILSKYIPEDAHGLAKSTVTERIKQGLKLID